MIGLLGIGLGLYGVCALKKDIDYTKKDLKIKGTGTIAEQKRNIDANFVDILQYSQAKCTIKNHRVIDAQPNQYGGMEIYLMKKGYSQEAINYCKNKFDIIAQQSQQNIIRERNNKMFNFENALKKYQSREMAIFTQENGYATKQEFDKVINRRIDYLHNHNNPNARVNVIVGGTTSMYDFDATYIIKAPYGYDGQSYIKELMNKIQ